MAFRALRRTSAEIDEQHLAESDRSASRRKFLTRAATGGALAVGASTLPLSTFVPGASAQTDGGAEPTTGTTPVSSSRMIRAAACARRASIAVSRATAFHARC